MAGPAKFTEQEVKLGADAAFVLPDLDAAGVPAVEGDGGGGVGGLRWVPMSERRLTTTYWDTEDLRLTRSGISLRHRSAGEGTDRGWTVKLADTRKGGQGLNRTEVGFAGPDGEPPAEAVALVTATTRGAPLQPVATLVTQRRRLGVHDAQGRMALEVADDDVSVVDGEQVVDRFREIEVEVALGEHDGAALLSRVVETLLDAGAGAPDPTPKIARALGERAMAPPDVDVPEIGPEATAGDVVRAAIASGTRRLVAHDPGVRLGGDDEDVHQARVATRRLRSDLATFRPLLDRDWVAQVRAELWWVAGELGAVRDADVLGMRLRRQAEGLGEADAAAAKPLLRALDDERVKAGSRAGAALGTPRYAALLDQLVAASQAPPLTEAAGEPAADLVPGLVARSWRRLRKTVDEAGEEPPDELLHEVRKAAKRCRYACEAAVPVAGNGAAVMAEAVEGIQEVLGNLQDAAVAELWLRSQALALQGADATGAVFTAGLLTGVQQQAAADARQEWRGAWKAARKKKLRAWLS